MQNHSKAHTAYFSMTEYIWQTDDNLWTVASYISRFESVCLLFEGGIKRQSLSAQSTFFARTVCQYVQRKWLCFKIRVPSCVKKYFQKMQDPLKCKRSSIWDFLQNKVKWITGGKLTPNYWQTQSPYVMIFLQELQCSGIQSNIPHIGILPILSLQNNSKLRGFSPRVKHTDRAAAAGRRS
jgi:hypothetical protein